MIDKHAANLAVLARMHPDVVTEHADLAEPGTWERHFAGADAVVMLQAQIGGTDPLPFVRNNITATDLILDAIERHAVPYTVHVSSSVVCSVADDDYTRTKREQEQRVAARGIPAVILRPTLMFGWFDRKHLGWLSRFMRRVPVFPIPAMDATCASHCMPAISPPSSPAACARALLASATTSPAEKVDYIDIIRQIKRSTRARTLLLHIPYRLFHLLLRTWALFDRDPPFTAAQLQALVAHDEFEVIDWPSIFNVRPTPFAQAIDATFNDPEYGDIARVLIMSERIAVLGAGPMGLAVAYQLARDGHQPVVFEADDRVGGMTASFDFGGMPIERYYHFHCTSDHDFLTVLDELGLGERMRWTETRMGYWFGKRLQPWGNPIALLRFRGLGMMAKIRYGLHAFLCTRRNDWRPLDHVEASSGSAAGLAPKPTKRCGAGCSTTSSTTMPATCPRPGSGAGSGASGAPVTA